MDLIVGIVSTISSALVALIGYFLKNNYNQFKELVNSLKDQVKELNHSVMTLDIYIKKGVESDIKLNQQKLKELSKRTLDLEEAIAKLLKDKQGE